MMPAVRFSIVRLALFALPAAALAAVAVAVLRPGPGPVRVDDVPPVVAPDQIVMVIDNSASMKGYFAGRTAFKDMLATLTAVLPQPVEPAAMVTAPATDAPAADAAPRRAPDVSYYFTQDEGLALARLEGGATALIDTLLDERVPFARSSFLQDMLGQLQGLLNQSPGAVGILVTDALMSYPNERVAKNVEINRDSIRVLAAKMQDALAPTGSTPGLQLSVLQYVSAFNGVYYTYRNEPVTLSGRDRPFYLWLLGHADRVDAIVQRLRRHRDLRPAHEVTLPQRARPHPRILRYSDREGVWFRDRVDPLTLVSVKASDGRAVKFQVALDLPHVPGDVASLAHLAKHVRADPHLMNVDVQVRTSVARHAEDAGDLDRATHFLDIRASGLQADTADLQIILPDVLPDWCAAASSDDDHDVADEEVPRTFGLLPLLEGAATAFRVADRAVFQFTITLRR